MRCSTRILLVTAFAIFAGLGLLAASTRTVAREVAPRSPAAQISSSEDDNDEAWDTDAALCFAWNVLQRASRLALPEKWEALAKEVQRIAEGGENGLEMRPL